MLESFYWKYLVDVDRHVDQVRCNWHAAHVIFRELACGSRVMNGLPR